jgi:hypothetical protein
MGFFMFWVPCIMDQDVDKYQQDVTLQYFYFLFFNISTCFGQCVMYFIISYKTATF